MALPGGDLRRAVLGGVVFALFMSVSALAWCTPPDGACGSGSPSDEGPPSETELSILAGSELEDVFDETAPFVEDLRRETGISLVVDYAGTLEGADRLVVQKEDYDLAWFSSDRYLQMLADDQNVDVPASCGPLMRSPVILGVKQQKAQQLGWSDGASVTWDDVAEAAKNRQFTFGMTNPASSNSGFSALVGVAAVLEASDPFESLDMRRLEELFSGTVLPAGSSRWLSDAFVTDPASADGLINYESELIRLNQDELDDDDDLVLVYPTDGVVYADYPMTLINPDRRSEYDAIRRWLLREETQSLLMERTHRRPVADSVELDNALPSDIPDALPLPDRLEAVDRLILAYLDEFRLPTRTYYLIDTSISMNDPLYEGGPRRLDALADAFDSLTGNDTSVIGRFSRFRQDEKVTIIPYARGPREAEVGEFLINDPEDNPSGLGDLRAFVPSFDGRLQGGTGIYDVLKFVYERAKTEEAENEPYYTSIVLMTDAEQNSTIPFDLASFTSWYNAENMGSLHVKTFVVKFGDASEVEMAAVADLTKGELFPAGTSLSDVFKKIRGYQ